MRFGNFGGGLGRGPLEWSAGGFGATDGFPIDNFRSPDGSSGAYCKEEVSLLGLTRQLTISSHSQAFDNGLTADIVGFWEGGGGSGGVIFWGDCDCETGGVIFCGDCGTGALCPPPPTGFNFGIPPANRPASPGGATTP